MMGRRSAAAAGCLCGVILCLSGCRTGLKSGRVPEYVFTYAENQTGDYPTTAGARYFAERVNKESGGRIEILVYANAELGDENAAVEQVRFGGIDFARASLSSLNACSPKAIVLQMPYLYKDAEHMWRVLDGEIGAEIMASFEGSGVVGLSWYDAGARNFYNSKREIKSMADMQGLKIRVQESGLMMDMVKALGASPTPMAYGEVYSGLQTGVIDGAENNWPSYESTSHYEVAKYYVIDEHSRIPEMQIISKQTWDKLSADDQKILRECAAESSKYERELWAKQEQESEKKVRDGGSVITKLSEEARAEFVKAMEPLYEKYGADYKELIDQIRAVK